MNSKFLKLALSFFIGVLLFTACSTEDPDAVALELQTDDIQTLLLAEDISSEIAIILEDDDFNFSSLKSETSIKNKTIDCATRTLVRDEASQSRTITLDFGDGCVGERGKKLAGKLITVFQRLDNGFTKSVTFEGFSVNDNEVEGSKSLLIVKENTNGNRESEHIVSLKITLTTGEVISLNQTKSREMIEGGSTLRRGDDVYLIGGNSTFINKNGIEFSTTIKEKLRKAIACRFILSGVKEIVRNGNTFTLDFGDGECDNKALLTNLEGETKEIRL